MPPNAMVLIWSNFMMMMMNASLSPPLCMCENPTPTYDNAFRPLFVCLLVDTLYMEVFPPYSVSSQDKEDTNMPKGPKVGEVEGGQTRLFPMRRFQQTFIGLA